MIDYLVELWQTMSVAYISRLSFLNYLLPVDKEKEAESFPGKMIYARLECETS